jgi:very-short-patch-repair endonuclease
MHRPIGQTRRSPFHVIGSQLNLRANNIPLLNQRLDSAADWTADKLASADKAAKDASGAIAKLGVVPNKHPWFGTNIALQSPFDIERLTLKLRVALDNVSLLPAQLARVFSHVGGGSEPTIEDAFATARSFRHVAAAPASSRSALADPQWVQNLEKIEHAIVDCKAFAALFGELEGLFHQAALTFEVGPLLFTLRADGPSFFRRLSSRYRQATADLRALCRDQPPKKAAARITLVERLEEGQRRLQAYWETKQLMSSALGPLWHDLDTQWGDAQILASWVRAALGELGGARLVAMAARSPDPMVFSDFADALAAAQEAKHTVEELQADVGADFGTRVDPLRLLHIPIQTLQSCFSNWLQHTAAINDWVQARDALSHLRDEGLGLIADRLTNGELHPHQVRPVTELLISEALWRRATADCPDLTRIDGVARSAHVTEFRDLDQRRIRAARQEVLARYLDRRPNGHAGEMGIIRQEIDRRRGHRAVRKLMKDAGSAVQQLKPVFLMSPLSVAQFLPPGRLTFDLLVIDEASQVSPEDALGVVARAKQVVVVGDHKQLPPTNFFKMVNAGDDDPDENDEEAAIDVRASDFESILTLARTRGISERMLAWHYRSKHPSLIALSNEECYGGRLLLPPSPFVQTSEFGLSLVKTPRGHYDRGGTSRDLVQAEEVAKAIAQHIRQHPNKSLGVACLSAQQRDAVDDMVDKLGIRSEVEGFNPKDERLFVKNLEAVQGDERDVIFISVGYGVAPNQSRPFLNFGPVSRDGGERRLNVLASRAREKCLVFSSITAADIPADNEVRGTRMLRSLLHFAETGHLAAGIPDPRFDSPFEEAVARLIREAGYHVHSQVGVSSFRIDLGVIDPARPGEYILGVECDGATYHSARSARDRDRLRQEVLEGLGWRLHRIWSTDWFRRPQQEADRLLTAIRNAQAKAMVSTGATPEAEDEVEPELGEDDNCDDENKIADADILPSIKPSIIRDYEQCSLNVPYRRDISDLSSAEIGRLALTVVEAEGPIHTEEIARRIREAFGLQRTGNRILDQIRGALRSLSRSRSLSQDGEFWSIPGRAIRLYAAGELHHCRYGRLL